MNNEDAHAHRICRSFVLSILGIVVITFLLVHLFFHAPLPRNTLEGMMMRLNNFCRAMAQEARRSAFHCFKVSRRSDGCLASQGW